MVDITVVGGGLAGCASAYYLSRSGARVVVLERGQINQGASGQNAGSLHFQLEHRLIQEMDKHRRELEYQVGLAKIAIRLWQEIEQELGMDTELAMNGGLMVAETAAEIALLERKLAIEQSQGLAVELLDRDAAQQIAPYLSDRVQAALYCSNEGHCNPRLLTPAYAGRAEQHGAQFITGANVIGVRRVAGKWQVTYRAGEPSGQSVSHAAGHRTSRPTAQPAQSVDWPWGQPAAQSTDHPADHARGEVRQIHSDILLNTAGAWAVNVAALAHLHLPLFPVGLTMNATERTDPCIPHLIQHVGRKLSLKQTEDGNVLIGGGWRAHLQQSGGHWASHASPQIQLDSVMGNLRIAAEIVPLVRSLRLLRTWTGTTAITPDQLPVLGEFPQAPGFFVAAGGSGFTYGPAYAKLMSELILTGAPSYPLDPFSPARFTSLNAFMG